MSDLSREMADLSQQTAQLTDRLGEVAGELAELNSISASFVARFQREVLPQHEKLVSVRREIADLRAIQGSVGARASAEIDSPLHRYLVEDQSVLAQYERVWEGKVAPTPTTPEDVFSPASKELKQLYARVVAKLHPGLSDVPAESSRRQNMIKKVDEAYVRRDMVSLRALADAYHDRSNLPAIVDENTVKQLHEHVYALESLIAELEGQAFELRHGKMARLRGHAEHAQAQGKDFLRDLSEEIQRDLRRAREELESLRA